MTVDTLTTSADASVSDDASALKRPFVARGALDGYTEAFAAAEGAVSFRVLPLTRAYNLRVDPQGTGADAVAAVLGTGLPATSRWSATSFGGSVVWLGPDEWLVTDPSGSATLEDELADAVLPNGGAVTEQSGQRVSIEVTGDAPGLLAKGTAFDLHPAAFGRGSALQGFLGQAVVVFLARATGSGADDSSAIEILVRSSFARYVGDWLLDAVRDPLAYPASN